MKALLVTGTVREGNKSQQVAKEALNYFSEAGDAKLFDLCEKEVPLMEQRLSHDDSPPEDVKEFRELVDWSDVVILVTPEYNHSIPGALKNLIDYLYEEYDGKAFSYITISAGGFGGVRAQSHLHDITLAVGGRPGPSLHVSNVNEHFSEENISEEYQERLKSFAEKVEDFV
ncbi:MAG: NAD(P)H-dependent oxidoreductase [Candidatus Nanohaloarchaea archaeon]